MTCPAVELRFRQRIFYSRPNESTKMKPYRYPPALVALLAPPNPASEMILAPMRASRRMAYMFAKPILDSVLKEASK
jgi:hypothetical protein